MLRSMLHVPAAVVVLPRYFYVLLRDRDHTGIDDEVNRGRRRRNPGKLWLAKRSTGKRWKSMRYRIKEMSFCKRRDGRFNPQFDENDTRTVECENVYLSIGQSILWGDAEGFQGRLGRGNGAVADEN